MLALLLGCSKIGCLTGNDPECVVPSPCEEVAFTCAGGFAEAFVLAEGDAVPVEGGSALAAPGDVVLRNDRVVAVLDALDHPHYVAPTGGSLLDLQPVDGTDGLRNLIQATGVLPADALHYTDFRILDTEDDVAAVQFNGTLDGHPDIVVATRYELRPCEDGVRVRTEVVNREPDPFPLFLVDAFYWGDRQYLPFTPAAGFEHPSFGLTTIADALRDVPWMAAGAHPGGGASYGVTGCGRNEIQGFQATELSALGPPKRVLPPRDYEVYERFVATAPGPGVSAASDVLAEVRRQVAGARTATVRGRLVTSDGTTLGDMVRASLVAVGPDGPATQVVPASDGTFHARLPAGQRYDLQLEAFGRKVATFEADLRGGDLDLGTLPAPGVGQLVLDATIDGARDELLVFVHPSDEAGEAALAAALYGNWDACAPLLGNPWGPSPACNRVLVNGPTAVSLPEGTYDVLASAGPFSTLARVAGVAVEAGDAIPVTLAVEMLELEPEGTLSADFHVHGAASFDSATPDLDRVRAFLAARIDVVASTDHDVVNDYAEAVAALDADERMRLLVGLETTGHVLFPLVETTIYPKVIGHFNFWPIPYDPAGPWRGAPWDELAEPGELFTRIEEAGWPPQTGVIQLNHPWGGLQFGRDYAWPTAIGLDLTEPLPERYDGTGQGLFLRTPPQATYSNADYHVQEVMNGSSNAQFVQYRAVWHYLLAQGVVRAGTANSDSHSLVDNVLGTPRTLVYTDETVQDFDEVAFDAAVRAGRMLGTNGPVIEVSTTDASGAPRTPSLEAFAPDPQASLHVEVRAAPWVPVEEVRVLVNGEVVRTLVPDVVAPADPFGRDGLERLVADLPLAELLPAGGDAWIGVEAGVPLPINADLDCNGVPDTGDNDADGTIDWRDVEELTEDPGTDCLDTVGPLAEPPVPGRGQPGSWFERVTPLGQPTAFTNPLLLDRDGGGWDGVQR